MKRRTILLAALLALALPSAAQAAIDIAIDPGGAYATACEGGATGLEYGGDNDIAVACALSEPERVICGWPGLVGWLPADGGQVTVTCEAGGKP